MKFQMKNVAFVLFLMISVSSFSQNSKALAKAYLVKAEESFKIKDDANTEKYLKKSIQYFGVNKPKELALLATKYYVSGKKYSKAKEFAELYFKLEKNQNSKEYNEMLLVFIDIEDNLESKTVVKQKETAADAKVEVKENPVVVKKPLPTKKGKKKKRKVGKTLREAYLLSKKYFDEKKYDFAGDNLVQFFSLNPKKETRFYKEMLELKAKVEKEIVSNNKSIVKSPTISNVDDNEVEETVIESTETDEDEAVEVEEVVSEEEIVADVPFAIIEEVPVFPGCEGTRKEKSDCLNKRIKTTVLRNFNFDLVNDLGLSSGKKKIWVGFRIDENGNVVEVSARAPHPKLKEEAVRVVKLLPQMQPGKQRGKAVGMKYTLPLSINVEDDSEEETKEN